MRIYRRFNRFVCCIIAIAVCLSSGVLAENGLMADDLVMDMESAVMDSVLTLIVELEGGGVLERCGAPSGYTEDVAVAKSVARIQSAAEATVAAVTETEVEGRLTHIMNAIVVKGSYSDIEELEALPDVKAVYISEDIDIVKPVDTVSAEAMGSADYACADQNGLLGDSGVRSTYNGDGLVIGIVDSELWYDHPVFDAVPTDSALDISDIESYLGTKSFVAETKYSGLKASDVYKNGKIPFAFDYANNDPNPKTDNTANYHGTHVAGIAVADGDGMTGVASNAQLAFAKVSPDGSSSTSTILMGYALDDLVKLGVDVINMSMSVPAGFSDGQGFFDAVYKKIEDAGIAIVISAGNEGRYGDAFITGAPLANAPDYGLLGSPATNEYSTAVASIGYDSERPYEYTFSLSDGSVMDYYDSSWTFCEARFAEALDGKTVEYVDCGLGNSTGYANITTLEGKIALITRGGASFSDSVGTAEEKGAVAAIIINTENAYGNIFAGEATIPCAIVTATNGAVLKAARNKTISVTKMPYKISSFSSRGATPDLRLKPEITAMGQWVYSAYYNGGYTYNAGTSMSAPQYAGACVSVLDYINKKVNPAMSKNAKRTLAAQLLCSTAQVWAEDGTTDGVPASPRAQGAGVVNIEKAVTTPAVLMNTYNSKTKVELGEISEPEFELEFKVKNISAQAVTYNLSTELITDGTKQVTFEDGTMENVVDGVRRMEEASVTFEGGKSITVPAGAEKTVKATVCLDDAEVAELGKVFTNGFFVEGYIYLSNDVNPMLSIPFMGFYGDWSAVPVFGGADYGLETLLIRDAEDYKALLNSVGGLSYFSPLTGKLGVSLQNARNIKLMKLLIYDSDGNEVYRAQQSYIRRNMDIKKSVLVGEFDGKLKGTTLPDGNYTVMIEAAADCVDGLEDPQVLTFDIVIDSVTPELYDAALITDTVEGVAGRWLWVNAESAEDITPIYGLIDSEGVIVRPKYYTDSGYRLFNVTGYSLSSCKIYIQDLACNAAEYDITAHTGYSVAFDGAVFKGSSLWDAYVVKDIILNRYDVAADSGGYTKRLFVWDDNMQPVAKAFTVQ